MKIIIYDTFKEFEQNYLIEIESIKDKPQLLNYINESLKEYKEINELKEELISLNFGFIAQEEFESDEELIKIKTDNITGESIVLTAIQYTQLEKTQREFIKRVETDFDIINIELLNILSSYYEKLQSQHLKLLKFNNLINNLDREYTSIIEYLQFELFENKYKTILKEPSTVKERGKNIPYKMALLNEIGFYNLLKRFNNDTDRYKIIQYLIGGNPDNIKKYYKSLNTDQVSNINIQDKHTDWARKFIGQF